MKRIQTGLTFLLALGAATASAQPTAAPPAAAATAAAHPFVGNGPYPAISEAASGLPTHTLYRPRDLAGVSGGRLPIVLFANGACANDNRFFRPFLTEVASHGYLVVAI